MSADELERAAQVVEDVYGVRWATVESSSSTGDDEARIGDPPAHDG